MSNCCVPHCYTNSKDYILISFHTFPSGKPTNTLWKRLASQKCQHLRIQKSQTKVCGLHFIGGRKTYDGKTPTIFPWSAEWPNVVEEYNATVNQWFRARCGMTTECTLATVNLDHIYPKQPMQATALFCARLLHCSADCQQDSTIFRDRDVQESAYTNRLYLCIICFDSLYLNTIKRLRTCILYIS